MTKQMIFLDDEPAGEAVLDRTPNPPDPDPSLGGDPNDFRIDPHTREVGRIGIAAARQALAEAVKRAAAREQKLAA
ncbi:MAG: hypothetical protein J2P57_04360 [Acidimicrobiaceae bacterium]|nr:hypothetical protein [Acidimicrobiaceae bacterium]